MRSQPGSRSAGIMSGRILLDLVSEAMSDLTRLLVIRQSSWQPLGCDSYYHGLVLAPGAVVSARCESHHET